MTLTPTTRAILLWLATTLFLARVIGQILVGIYSPPQLPPWPEWYSGLLPYPWLLLSQILILMLMAVANTDTIRQQGALFVTSPRTRYWLRLFAVLYASSMILRYTLRMILQSDQRWFGGTIPIWFHLVLAAWIFLLAVSIKDSNSQKTLHKH
ncbi:hypothetical protein FEM03_16870 [Phragmitibacter flavus]|uniref:Uncharacterized protein n=1 Tax=Phragmitibacter flavus TaxID=2576071 RepID=A0A5R8KDH0_9BACT|nr:hypothetical protein [Phragmitibacter flavus]TLD69629.1 hypothetical protein FEM03_16870 [Phragmitibacter flavus]